MTAAGSGIRDSAVLQRHHMRNVYMLLKTSVSSVGAQGRSSIEVLMMRSLLLALFVVMALASHAAFAFDVVVPDKTFAVSTGGSKEIAAAVQNASDEKILFDLVGETPWMTLSTSQLDMKKGEAGEIVLYVSPYPTTSPGLYKVSLAAESALTREKKVKDIYISVTRGEGVEIEKIEVSGDLEPLGSATVRFLIKNLGSVSVTAVDVVYTLDSPSATIMEGKATVNLEPEGSATVEKTLDFAAGQEAGDYVIKAGLFQNSRVLDSLDQRFTIPGKAIVRQTLEERTSLFRKEQTIKVTNYGNEDGSAVITGRVGNFESYFFAGTPPTRVEDDLYSWEVDGLKPGETRAVAYSLDFAPFYLFMIAALLLLWLFFVKMRAVRVRKFIMQKKFIEEGEEFTVGLEIINKTGKRIEELTARDLVPPIFEMKDAEGPRPARKKTGSGTELSWKVRDLGSNEERILAYKVVATFGVQGRVRLPRAAVVYPGRGKDTQVLSGFAGLGIEAEEKELRHHVKRHVERLRKAVRKK